MILLHTRQGLAMVGFFSHVIEGIYFCVLEDDPAKEQKRFACPILAHPPLSILPIRVAVICCGVMRRGELSRALPEFFQVLLFQ